VTVTVMWYGWLMSHTATSSHAGSFRVRLGERGRLVLPAELRRAAGLSEGDELTLTLEAGGLRLVGRRELARAGRGALAHLGRDRDLVGELLEERRAEAVSEQASASANDGRSRS
jgi:AbrB family looped-hinge helix DNA binding protein